jgi:hypothetical protein
MYLMKTWLVWEKVGESVERIAWGVRGGGSAAFGIFNNVDTKGEVLAR